MKRLISFILVMLLIILSINICVFADAVQISAGQMKAYSSGSRYAAGEGISNVLINSTNNYYVFHEAKDGLTHNGNGWLQIYLGKKYNVSKIELVMMQGNDFDVLTSVDGFNWTARGNYQLTNTNLATSTIDWSASPFEASWIRFETELPAQEVVYEVKVYADDGVVPDNSNKLIIGDISASASSVGIDIGLEDGLGGAAGFDNLVGSAPQKSIDGDMYRTYWQSEDHGAGTDDYITYDLGASYDLEKAIMYNIGSNNFNVSVYASDDNVTWGESAKTLTIDGENESTYYDGYKTLLDLSGITGRYIRIKKVSEASGANGDIWKLGEVMFFGDKADVKYPFADWGTDYQISTDDGLTYKAFGSLKNGKAKITKRVSSTNDKSGVLITGLYNRYTHQMLNCAVKPFDFSLTDGRENVAFAKPARLLSSSSPNSYYETGSDYELPGSAGNIAEYGVDGSSSTFAVAGGQWNWMYEVNFGGTYNVNYVNLTFGDNGYPIDYDILFAGADGIFTVAKHISTEEAT